MKRIADVKLSADGEDLSPYMRSLRLSPEHYPEAIQFQEPLSLEGAWTTEIPSEKIAKILGHPWADKKVGDVVYLDYEGQTIPAKIEDITTDERGCLSYSLLFQRPTSNQERDPAKRLS